MACGPCAARKAALAASQTKYLWTAPEGSDLPAVQYDSELQAKAKVMRKGGSYRPVAPASSE